MMDQDCAGQSADGIGKALRDVLSDARKWVVKIGSSLLVDDQGCPAEDRMAGLARDIALLRSKGGSVVLVSSGAVALGRKRLNVSKQIKRLDEKQACAAVGQVLLMQAWERAFARERITVAQALLTADDTERRRRWLNARATLERLMGFGICPVINENDTVATDEIRYGDNDRLAARVAQLVGADALVLLSDVDGLYTANPARDSTARRLERVPRITPEIEAMGAGPGGAFGTGGMRSKIDAARIATQVGCAVAITSGARPNPIATLLEGAPGTWFDPVGTPAAARKSWISGTLRPGGTIQIDDGARAALEQGRSLLPAGALAITGQFEKGEAVSIRDAGGGEIARGLAAYSAEDARAIMGLRSEDIEQALGYVGPSALVHRNDLVMGSGGQQPYGQQADGQEKDG